MQVAEVPIQQRTLELPPNIDSEQYEFGSGEAMHADDRCAASEMPSSNHRLSAH